MTVYEIVGGVVLLIVSLVILVLTLLQHTHGQGLSSAIGGGVQGANTTRLSPADQMLAKVTRIAGVIFFVVAIAACVLSSRRSRGRRPNLQAGCVPRRKFGQRQPGAALRFLQAPSAARRKNRLSARGLSRNRKKMPGKGCVPLERAGACTPKRPRSNAGLFLCPGRKEKRPAVKSRPPEAKENLPVCQ